MTKRMLIVGLSVTALLWAVAIIYRIIDTLSIFWKWGVKDNDLV